MTIYLVADHRGFALKEQLKKTLQEQGLTVQDLGATTLAPDDDYPDHAAVLAAALASDREGLGIALCGSGVGMAIALNRHKYIRCGLGLSVEQVTAARRDDNINVLALAADYTDEVLANAMISAFLKTDFANLERYVRRLNKLS